MSTETDPVASPGQAPALEVDRLTVSYSSRPVLWDVDARIPAGRLAAVVGPNGAGKSTLLKAVVGLQGVEWVGLIAQGLTMTSSTHGGFFYLIVGSHALHAVIAIGVVAWATLRLFKGALTLGELQATSVFWFFVVLLWPFLYWKVYL